MSNFDVLSTQYVLYVRNPNNDSGIYICLLLLFSFVVVHIILLFFCIFLILLLSFKLLFGL